MPATLNPLVEAVLTPPIADVQGWVANRVFPSEKPLLNVAQAVPSYPPAESLRAYLAKTALAPATAVYTDILGLTELRSALAQHLSEDYRASIEATEVAITAGCNQAFCVTVDALAGPGDEVILPLPYYFNHQMWLAMRGIKPRYVPYREAQSSAQDIEALIGSRTKAIALISPNNPTGGEYSSQYLLDIFHLAREHNLALVMDETYKDFRSCGGPPHTIFQISDWAEHFVHLYSFSKSYAMTGYRVGAVVAHPDLIASVEKILDCLAICPSHLSQRAAMYALENLGSWREERAVEMRQRMSTLHNEFRRNELRYELVSSGAFFAYVRHPFDSDAHTVAKRLADEHNLLCLPGSMFGPDQERYLRFAFANLATRDIPELITRLIDSQQPG